jgi:hypothetical protein
MQARHNNFSGEQEIRFQLDYEIAEDIPAEIEAFVRLSRLGLFTDAAELFDQTLRPYLNLFPVLAEYADFLLEREESQAWEECSELLTTKSRENEFCASEVELIRLLKCLSETYTQKNFDASIDVARVWHVNCAKTFPAFDKVDPGRDEVQVRQKI